MIILSLPPIESDPDIEVGGFLTLERADGRSKWSTRFMVVHKDVYQRGTFYEFVEVDEYGKPKL